MPSQPGRPRFIPSALLLIGVGLLLHRWRNEPYAFRRGDRTLPVRGTVGRLVRSTRVRRLLTAHTLFAITTQSVIGFLPTFLQFEKGFSPALASAGFALVFVIGGIVGPLAGRMSDRLSRLWIIFGGSVCLLVGLGGLVGTAVVPTVLFAVAVLSVGMGTILAVTPAYLTDLFPESSVGADFGAAKTIYTGIGSLGPTYVGAVAVRPGYGVAFATLVPLVLLGIGFILAFPRQVN